MSKEPMTLEAFLKEVGCTAADLTERLEGDEALATVRQTGLALQFVSVQTVAICLAAVRQYGPALKYVRVSVFA